MAEPLATSHIPDNIEALIEGEVSGQVAVGNYNVQIVADHGAVVHFAPPETRPKPRPRPSPILLRPRPFRGLLDRKEDAEAAAAALRDSLPVEICGPPGIGKSSLLRHLAYAVPADGWPDGVVHLSAGAAAAGGGQAAGDLLQALFDAFYECDVPFKPTEVQTRQFLQARAALVLVDDLELDRQGVEELLNAAPGCAFLLISRQRCLWGEGRALTLASLPPEDALALFERGLERPLAEGEKAAAAGLCARLEGNPLRILQAAARAKEERRPIAGDVLPAGTGISSLPDTERKVLAVLAALGGGPVGAAHLAALAEVPDLEPLVQDLQQRRLVQAHSPRYSLTGSLAADLEARWKLDPWRQRALAYFTGWAAANRTEAAVVMAESGVLRRLLAWAVQSGRRDEAMRLGRALEGALLLAGRWCAWAETLEAVRRAAQAKGDAAAEGWSLHQLGTRLLCLDDKPGARQLLTRALEIRETLGDRKGAAITRHNLGLIAVPPPPSPAKPRKGNLRLLPWAVLPLLVLLTAAGVWLARQPTEEKARQIMEMPASSQQTAVSGSASPPTGAAGDSGTAPTTDGSGPGTGSVEPPAQPQPPVQPPVQPKPPVQPPQPPATPELGVRPQRIDFQGIVLGDRAKPERVVIANTGTAPLEVERIAFADNPGDAFALGSGCDGRSIPPRGRCDVAISFAPPKAGSYQASLWIRASGQTVTLAVSGTAAEPKRPALALSHQRFDFKPLKPGATSTPVEVEIVNTGEAPLRIDTRVLAGSGAADFRLDDRCGSAEIAPQDRCRFAVRFAPGTAGPHAARVVVADRADDLQQELTLSGAGLEEPKGWCCRDGQTSGATAAECAEARGQFSTGEREARFLCAAGKAAAATGCCLDGVFGANLTAAECAQRQGVAMSALQAALPGGCRKPRAPREPREPQGSGGDGGTKRLPQPVWCCVEGRPFQLTVPQCEARRGVPFRTVEEVRAQCRPPAQNPRAPQETKLGPRPNVTQRVILGYCCLNGSAFRSTSNDCRAKKGFFSLLEKDADNACRPR